MAFENRCDIIVLFLLLFLSQLQIIGKYKDEMHMLLYPPNLLIEYSWTE